MEKERPTVLPMRKRLNLLENLLFYLGGGENIYQIAVKRGCDTGEPKEQIARRIYLGYPTFVFKDKEDKEFEILNEIALHFRVPFTSVQIVGSAKTGFSFVNRTPFIEKKSDCDIAIIDSGTFTSLLEYAHQQTNGFKDFTKYDLKRYILDKTTGYSMSDKLRFDISQGYINPYYLPDGDFKEKWLIFFEQLSDKYPEQFKRIDGAAYASQYLFEMKQYGAIQKFLAGGKGNATL
jgi:hypothetical protein